MTEMKSMAKRIEDWVARNYGQSEAENPSWDIEKLAKEVELIDVVSLKELRDKIYKISGRLYDTTMDNVDASFALDLVVDELDDIIENWEV
jgi:hypothetical protein